MLNVLQKSLVSWQYISGWSATRGYVETHDFGSSHVFVFDTTSKYHLENKTVMVRLY